MNNHYFRTTANGIEFYSRNNMTLHQEKMLELLEFFISVCNDNNIDYWLDGGGLLGLARHGKMIPWDDDIDICVPAYDYKRCLCKLDEKSENSEVVQLYFKSQGLKSWCEYLTRKDYYYITKTGFKKNINIDIFPVKFITQDRLCEDFKKVKKAASFIKNYGNHGFKSKSEALAAKEKYLNEYNEYIIQNSVFKDDCWLIKGHGQYSPIKKINCDIVYPLKTTDFCGIKIKVPNDLDSYLVKSYGNNYMTLPPLDKRKPEGINTLKVLEHSEGQLILKQSVEIENETFYYTSKLSNAIWKFFKLLKQNGLFKALSIVMLNAKQRK